VGSPLTSTTGSSRRSRLVLQDKKQGYGYNPDKFGPAIVAATCIEPEMTVEDAKEIWKSDDWNRGERMQLLMAAIEVCTQVSTSLSRSAPPVDESVRPGDALL
jgi:hypothetical protein